MGGAWGVCMWMCYVILIVESRGPPTGRTRACAWGRLCDPLRVGEFARPSEKSGD